MPSQKVPPETADFVTLNITSVPAQEAFLVDATTVTSSGHRWIEAKDLSG
jgi:hypothetical protein